MRVLYLCSPSSDYLQDIVFGGLVKTLGIRNVKVIPFCKGYAFNYKKYPKNLGYSAAYMPGVVYHSFSRKDFDCVIVASAKKEAFKTYLTIIDQIDEGCPVVFLDGGDVATIGGDLQRHGCYELFEEACSRREFDLIFKREMLIGEQYAKNVLPCPFAFNLDVLKSIPAVNKKYDVSFWAVESHPIRTQALTLLQDLYDCRENGTVLNQKFSNYSRRGLEYLKELKRCKVVLNFRGGGWDTLRFWETMALSTFMISQKPQIVIPDDFTDGENIVYCGDDLSDLQDKITYYLENDREREEIAANSYQHLATYHSDVARGNFILKAILDLKT